MTHGIDRSPIRFVVLAGNIREYRNWMAYNRVQPQETLFVSNSQILMGRKFDSLTTTFVEVGTFLSRQDAHELLAVLSTRVTNGKLDIVQGTR